MKLETNFNLNECSQLQVLTRSIFAKCHYCSAFVFCCLGHYYSNIFFYEAVRMVLLDGADHEDQNCSRDSPFIG